MRELRALAMAGAVMVMMIAGACGGKDTSDATTDAGTSDAVGGAAAVDGAQGGSGGSVITPDATVLACPNTLKACPSPFAAEGTPVVTSAAALGVDRLIDFDAHWVLAERDLDGGVQTVVSRLPVPPAELVAPVAAGKSVAIADRFGSAVVLMCEAAVCSLYETSEATGSLVPIAGAQVPAAAGIPEGIAATEDVVCVFGDGLHCFEAGSWSQRVASGGPRFRAGDWGARLLLAGDAGRLTSVGSDGTVTEIQTGVSAALRAVSVSPEWIELDAVVAGDSGTLLTLSGTTISGCSLWAQSLVGAVASWWVGSDTHPLAVIGADGQLGWNAPGSWCGHATSAESVLRGKLVRCGAAQNLLWLTESELFGELVCVST